MDSFAQRPPSAWTNHATVYFLVNQSRDGPCLHGPVTWGSHATSTSIRTHPRGANPIARAEP
eukprot:720446-Prorocentrum_minimum.AAC.1